MSHHVQSRRRIVTAIVISLLGACASAQTAPAAQRLFLFQYAPGPAWRAGAPMREQGLGPHGAYMQQLLNEGRLFAGGGYVNADGGMAIVIAADLEDARAMLAADPAIASGIFVAELRQWRPRFASDEALPASN
jgi:uncharacterized protein YciI